VTRKEQCSAAFGEAADVALLAAMESLAPAAPVGFVEFANVSPWESS
jgi:hypothetical protein